MDLPLLVTTAGLVNNALSSLKSARDLAKIVGNADLKEDISAAYDALQDLRERALDLDEENRRLKAQLAAKAAYVGPVAPYGYIYTATDEAQKHPVCPRCFQGTPSIVAYMGSQDREFAQPRRLCNMCNLAIYGLA